MATKSKQTRAHRRTDINFETYIQRVLKQIHPDAGITYNTLRGLDSAIVGVAEQIIKCAQTLAILGERVTITAREIQFAVKSVFPGELGNHAQGEGMKAVTKFNASLAGYVGRGKGSGDRSNSVRAGLKFSVSRMQNLIREKMFGGRVSPGASIYLAAAIEYLTAEILELAGNASRDNKKVRITRRHITLAVRADEELNVLFKHAVLGGGVAPFIHRAIENRKNTGKEAPAAQAF